MVSARDIVGFSPACMPTVDCSFAFSFNAGQTCAATSRLYVHENIYDDFVKRFTSHTREIKVGDPFDLNSFQGPLVSETQYNVCFIQTGCCH